MLVQIIGVSVGVVGALSVVVAFVPSAKASSGLNAVSSAMQMLFGIIALSASYVILAGVRP